MQRLLVPDQEILRSVLQDMRTACFVSACRDVRPVHATPSAILQNPPVRIV